MGRIQKSKRYVKNINCFLKGEGIIVSKNIFIVGNLKQRLNDQIDFCKSIKSKNELYNFIFIVDDLEKAAIVKDRSDFKIEFIEDKSLHSEKYIVKNLEISSKNKNLFYYIKNGFLQAAVILRYLSLYNSFYKRIKKIIKKYKPVTILVNGDRSLGIEQAVLKCAKNFKIKTMVPYLAIHGKGVLVLNEKEFDISIHSRSDSLASKVVMKMFPDQIIYMNGKKELFYLPYQTLACWLFGTLTRRPLCIGGGLADIICMGGSLSYERGLKMGVPESKMIKIGEYAYDILYNTLQKKDLYRSKFIEKYNFDNLKKTILIALPQYGEHKVLSWKEHWKELDFWMRTIKSLGVNICISLHPKMNIKNYEFFEEKYGCKIIIERLYNVLPLIDLFVANYSTTVLWATLCGVPSVIADFVRLNHTFYDNLKSVTVIKDRNRFLDVLKINLFAEIDFKKDWDVLMRRDVFDGNVINRYISLISS